MVLPTEEAEPTLTAQVPPGRAPSPIDRLSPYGTACGRLYMKPKIVVLLVASQNGHGRLIKQLEACGVDFLLACDCSEAREILKTKPGVHVVITDVTLPDGDWGSVLEVVRQGQANAEDVVCSRLPELAPWCEILQRGAYDLLVEPHQREEVRRIIEGAAARSHVRHHAAGA